MEGLVNMHATCRFSHICNPDISGLSGSEKKYLISGFGLFIFGNTGSNLGPDNIYLISGFLLY